MVPNKQILPADFLLITFDQILIPIQSIANHEIFTITNHSWAAFFQLPS